MQPNIFEIIALCENTVLKKLNLELLEPEGAIFHEVNEIKFRNMEVCYQPKYSKIAQAYAIICAFNESPREKLAIFVLDESFKQLYEVNFTVEPSDPKYNFVYDFEFFQGDTEVKSESNQIYLLIYDRPTINESQLSSKNLESLVALSNDYVLLLHLNNGRVQGFKKIRLNTGDLSSVLAITKIDITPHKNLLLQAHTTIKRDLNFYASKWNPEQQTFEAC